MKNSDITSDPQSLMLTLTVYTVETIIFILIQDDMQYDDKKGACQYTICWRFL